MIATSVVKTIVSGSDLLGYSWRDFVVSFSGVIWLLVSISSLVLVPSISTAIFAISVVEYYLVVRIGVLIKFIYNIPIKIRVLDLVIEVHLVVKLILTLSLTKQLHCDQTITAGLVRISLPFYIRFDRLLRERPCANFELFNIVEIREVFIALPKEFIFALWQLTIKNLYDICKVKWRVEGHPSQIPIAN